MVSAFITSFTSLPYHHSEGSYPALPSPPPTRTHTHFFLVLINFFIKNIYLLALLGPSCGTLDL